MHTEPTKEVDFIGDTDLRPTFQKGFLNREAAFENLKNKSFFSSSGSGFLVVNLPIVPNRIEKRSLNANLNKFSQLIY